MKHAMAICTDRSQVIYWMYEIFLADICNLLEMMNLDVF